MRGKRLVDWDLSDDEGIIPAHAGKTSWSVMWRQPLWDHPRPCGENQKRVWNL